MPSWLKKIVSLGHRPKGSTSVTKQDQSNSRSDFKSNAPLKGSGSNGQKSTPQSQPDERVGERKRTQPQENLPRNTTKNSEEQPRDSVNMTTTAATTAVSPTQKTSTSVTDHLHLSQRTGDLIQTSAHNGVGDIENSGSALNPNQIVLVLRSDTGGYRIYSLLEEEPSPSAAAAAKSSDESASDDGEKIKKAKVINGKAGDDHGKTKKPSPFKLSVTYAQSLPEELTREFLVEKVPEHLAGVDELHVIVSTWSGLGLAAGFYEGVLRPLLEEGFGFEAVGDVVEGYDDDKEGRKARSGKTYQITFTKSADTVKDFARGLVSSSSSSSSAQGQQQQQQQPSRTIILLSGDGGIIDLLNGLDHHQLDVSSSPSPTPTPTLAILPLGTGNALFHSLHKSLYQPQGTDGPSPLVLGLRTLFKRGVSAPLPTFRAEFSPGAKLISGQPEVIPGGDDEPKDNLLFDVTSSSTPKKRPEITHLLGAIVFSYGFHASLVYESDTPAYRLHGDKRFGMAAGELLKLSHLYDAEVFVRRSSSSSSSSEREETLSKDSHSTYILLTLVSNLEKTFCISPASKPLDGQLRLVHFGFGEQGVIGGAVGAQAEAESRGKQTMDIMMAAYRDGAHINDPEEKFQDVVGYEEVEEIKVVINETNERWRKVCVDGTTVEVEKGGWVTVKREGGKERERLSVLVDKEVVVGR